MNTRNSKFISETCVVLHYRQAILHILKNMLALRSIYIKSNFSVYIGKTERLVMVFNLLNSGVNGQNMGDCLEM